MVLSSSTVEPGAEGTIRAAVDTKGRRGRLRKSVRVRTDSSVSPEERLTIEVVLVNQ